jgi:5'-phosphate synthase pdxT subunit
VLAEYDGNPVLGRDGKVLFATFHPELAADLRVHQLFLESV